MRSAALAIILVIRCAGYDLRGRIEPPMVASVFLNDANRPFERPVQTDAGGNFEFHKLPSGTYTIGISTIVHGAIRKTVEVGPGTADAKGHVDLVLRIDDLNGEPSDGRSAATISAAILSTPVRASKEYEQAQHCLSRRDSDCAIGHLRRAVQIAPAFTAAWNQLGTIAYQTRQYSDAEVNFRKALAAEPDAWEPSVNLGGVLLNLERPGEALELNQRAVARRPGEALANSQLGLNYLALNDLERAEKYLKIAVRLDPAHFSHPQLVLAQVYVRRGDNRAAINALRDFLVQHPDSSQAPDIRRQIASLEK